LGSQKIYSPTIISSSNMKLHVYKKRELSTYKIKFTHL